MFIESEEPDVVTVTGIDEELWESKVIVSGYCSLEVKPNTLEKVVSFLRQLDPFSNIQILHLPRCLSEHSSWVASHRCSLTKLNE